MVDPLLRGGEYPTVPPEPDAVEELRVWATAMSKHSPIEEWAHKADLMLSLVDRLKKAEALGEAFKKAAGVNATVAVTLGERIAALEGALEGVMVWYDYDRSCKSRGEIRPELNIQIVVKALAGAGE